MTPARLLALIRLAALPVFVAAERLVDRPAPGTEAFEVVLAVAAVYAVGTLLADRLRWRVPPAALAAADLAFVVALVATSGGPFSQLRYAFFLLPVAAAMLVGPRATALQSVACVVFYALIALAYPEHEEFREDARGFELTQVLFLTWMGAAATGISLLLTRRAEEVADLGASRGRLVAQALEAEDAARLRLAEALHDEPLQDVLAARQLLGAGDAELAREGLDRAAVQLREVMFDLHPSVLERAGLRAALRALAEREARRGGFSAQIEVDEDTEGLHDRLVFALTRELLSNAARHSEAEAVRIRVARRDGALELEVSDDGVGIDLAAATHALQNGHIGLATAAERVDAVGGEFAVSTAPDGLGTVARASLPV
jgi:two-component system, NarL family, sensor kinase